MERIKDRQSICSSKGCAYICISERCSVPRRGSVLREVLHSQGGGKIIPYVVEMVKVFNFELLKLKRLLCVSHVLQWFYGKKNGAIATMRKYKYTAANWDTRSRTSKNQAHRWFLCHWTALSPSGSHLNSVLSLSSCLFFCPVLFWELHLLLPGHLYNDSLECIVWLLLLSVAVIQTILM